MVLAFNEDALMWMAPFGLLGLLVFFGLWLHSWWSEAKEDKRRWGEIASRLGALGLRVVVAPRPPRRGEAETPGEWDELTRFMDDLIDGCWQPVSRVRCVRWFARGAVDGRTVRMAEVELVRRGDATVYVESFLLTTAPDHWPDFCLVHKQAARGIAAQSGAPLAHRWKITLAPINLLLMAKENAVGEAMATEALYNACSQFPKDEQWFVRGGAICCHWSLPLNGDRPERMTHRVGEFIGVMEWQLLRVPRRL